MLVDVPSIRSRRLELVSLSRAVVEALLRSSAEEAQSLLGADIPTGWPDEYDARFLRLRRKQLSLEPDTQRWLIRALVRTGPEKVMIGHAGFHGPPGANGLKAGDAVEIGYTVFPAFRGRGYATEAAAALLDWARSEHEIRHFIASVAPANAPSLAIVRKLGFVQTGDQWDEEDGLELVFELTR